MPVLPSELSGAGKTNAAPGRFESLLPDHGPSAGSDLPGGVFPPGSTGSMPVLPSGLPGSGKLDEAPGPVFGDLPPGNGPADAASILSNGVTGSSGTIDQILALATLASPTSTVGATSLSQNFTSFLHLPPPQAREVEPPDRFLPPPRAGGGLSGPAAKERKLDRLIEALEMMAAGLHLSQNRPIHAASPEN